jgi:hypothetical protein
VVWRTATTTTVVVFPAALPRAMRMNTAAPPHASRTYQCAWSSLAVARIGPTLVDPKLVGLGTCSVDGRLAVVPGSSTSVRNPRGGQDFPVCHLDERVQSAYLPPASRALCNGKTLAFQAKDAGSIPAARSIPFLCSRLLCPRWAGLVVSMKSMGWPWAFRNCKPLAGLCPFHHSRGFPG